MIDHRAKAERQGERGDKPQDGCAGPRVDFPAKRFSRNMNSASGGAIARGGYSSSASVAASYISKNGRKEIGGPRSPDESTGTSWNCSTRGSHAAIIAAGSPRGP
jgi:hypothetical protein